MGLNIVCNAFIYKIVAGFFSFMIKCIYFLLPVAIAFMNNTGSTRKARMGMDTKVTATVIN